jgi:two-component system OmpR family sensor kinase
MTGGRWREARWSRWSLRWSLVSGVCALTALALLVVGVTSALALRAHLSHRVDDELAAAVALIRSRDSQPRPPGQLEIMRSAVAPTDYVVEIRRRDGSLHLLPSSGARPARPLSAVAPPAAPGQQAGPVTLDGGAPGDFRAVTVGLQGATVVVGLPLSPVTDTVRRLLWIEAIAGGGVLLALVLSVRVLVGRRLRPLAEITATAAAIAAGDLERRVEAVPPPGRASGTEVGRLSAAVAGMLERIQAALQVRARSEERMRQFVADASHELRTPLTSIRGYAQLMRDGVIDAERRPDVLRRMDDEAARMGRLVDDLLALARLDSRTGDEPEPADGAQLYRDPVDLVAVARDCVADAQAAEPDRVITLAAPPRCPVSGDEAILRQVVGNLLANVRHHTPVTARAAVTIRREDGRVVVEVSDDGPGIPEDLRDRVFDRFVRLEPPRAGAGTGLGLAIVAEAVRVHDGRAGIRDDRRSGTTVWFTLPAQPPGATALPGR